MPFARAAGRLNFYDALLVQDGHELDKIRPPLDLAAWQSLPVAAVANPKPVFLTSLEPKDMRRVLDLHPYGHFPVILDGKLRGLASRKEIEEPILANERPEIHAAATRHPDQTIRDIGNAFLDAPFPVLVVVGREDGSVRGIITLHDMIRTQAAVQQ
jgi:CBS domain-containing protein